MVHDGDRVRLDHVGAMLLPWLTTKEDDPDASGRFGIGQQTLRALGGPLEVHCAPFQFRIEANGPVVSRPVAALKGVYAPSRHETLFVVPLLASVNLDHLQRFVAGLGVRALLFLRNVRRISFVELSSGERFVDHRLVDGERTALRLQLGDRRLRAERLEMRDPRSRRRYARYLVDRPLSRDEQRHDKATGPTTPVGVALPLSRSEPGGFYDRLPLPLPCGFAVSLNAQFDPDSARSTLLQNDWNRARIADLGHLLGSVATDAFKRDAASAWRAIPLEDEIPDDDESWIPEILQRSVVKPSQDRIRDRLKLDARRGSRGLEKIVYEDESLDGLLMPDDQEWLSPGFFAVVPESRDADGRWRRVLDELGVSKSIDPNDALELFRQDDGELGARSPAWFVAMAHAAITADVFDDFLQERSVLLADGRRIEPPGASDPRSLVRRMSPRSLAARLDVGLVVHPAYLADDALAATVVAELDEWGALIDEFDSADSVLQVLARDYAGNTIGHVQVDDDQLISLRDAFERLSEDDQRRLGPRIGRNVELRGFEYEWERERHDGWVSPPAAYLPKEIDRETDSFARAAADTPGIQWLDAGYAKLLKREGGRKELGAQRFLSRLGAGIAPRLHPPGNEATRWKRDARPASKIEGVSPRRQDLQVLEIEALSPRPTYLVNDRWSEDLDAVIEDICDDEIPERQRRRGLALLGVLARSWDRLYADHEHAQAVYPYDGHWTNPRGVIATWLSRAASEPWLPSADGAMAEPAELCLPTEANRHAYSGSDSMFLADVDDDVLRSQALIALRLRRGPSARTLIERLQELRGQRSVSPETGREAHVAYKLLALACPPEGVRRPVDDMSIADLRSAFGEGRRRRGLILIAGRWHTPKEVLAGEPVFGRHRPFVPGASAYALLWRTLGVREPEASDCVAVLRELTRRPLEADDRAVVLAAMRMLAGRLETLSRQARAQLRKLPLWVGARWRTARPIFAVEDPEVAMQIATQVAVWQSGFNSFAGLDGLLESLMVTPLRAEEFEPVSLDARGVVAGEDLRRRFALAVEHLREELFRADKSLYDTIGVPWKTLAAAPVIIESNLKLAADAEGKRVVIDAAAHMRFDPLAFTVRSSDDAGNADGGGRAVASLFAGDRTKVAWAWTSMWQRAGDNIAPDHLVPDDTEPQEDESDADHLIDLQSQVRKRRKRGSRKEDGPAKDRVNEVEVKKVKDIAEHEPDDGVVVNVGMSAGGVKFPPATRPGGTGRDAGNGTDRGHPGGADKADARQRIHAVLPPLDTREQLAFDAVREALRLKPQQVVDLRKRRGVGADMVDELRQYYELKMSSSGDFPAEITLTRSEVERAQTDPDFFLALVAGLEEASGELRVRFIFNPLERLAVRIKGEVTLSGVRDVEALEFRFKKLAVEDSEQAAHSSA